MQKHLNALQPEGRTDRTAHLLRNGIRFLSVLRRHNYVVIVAILVAVGLGVLKLLSDRNSPATYQATGSLMLHRIHSNSGTSSLHTAFLARSVPVETYSKVLVSDAILEKVLDTVRPFPPEINRQLPKEKWVRQLRATITVNADKRKNNIIGISCRSKDPQVPGAVLNAIFRSAQDFMESNQQSVTIGLVKSLDKERGELEKRLFQKERELFEAQRRVGEFNLGEKGETVHPLVQRALELNRSCVEAERRRVQLETALAAAQKTVDAGGSLTPQLRSLKTLLDKDRVDALLELEEKEALTKVQQKLHENRKTLASFCRYYGAAHPKVIKLRESIMQDTEYLSKAKTRLLDGINEPGLGRRLLQLIEESLAIELEREATLRKVYDRAAQEAMDVNGRLAEMAIAKREVSLLRQLHSTTLNRLARMDIAENQAQIRLAVLNKPATVGTPIPKTKPFRILVIAAFLGLLAGSAVVYGIDVLDDHFRSPEELTEQLGVPMLAMIRELKPRDSTGVDALQVCAAPQSVESEAFRTLRTALAFSGEEKERIAVTSAEPNDGKTTVVANLGVSCAQAGKKTLLIDADLRSPGLTRLLELRAREGLVTVLLAAEDVGKACEKRVVPSGVDHLDVLPSGPRPSNPAELLSSPRLSEILAWAEAHYDQVLVDCPPILVASEPVVVGRLTDGIILVIQPDKNRRRPLLRAVRDLTSLGVSVIGAVANRIGSEKTDSYYGYGGYGYGYGYGYGNDDDGGHVRTEDSAEERTFTMITPRRAG